MTTVWWRMERGGTPEEYEVYRALRSTGRTEPQDFHFESGRGFTVNSPRMYLRVQAPQFEEQKAHDALVRDAIESGARREYVPRANTYNRVRELLGRSGASTVPGA